MIVAASPKQSILFHTAMATCSLVRACVDVNQLERDAFQTTVATLGAPIDCIFSHSEMLRSSSGRSLGICRSSSSQNTPDVRERLTTMEKFPAAPLIIGTASFSASEDFSASSSDLSAESVADTDDFVSEETADTDDSHGSSIEPFHTHRDCAMVRCGSDGSMVTSEPVIESDYTRCDMPSECTRGNSKDFSTNTNLQMVDSPGMNWTDDKHSSYLNSIEATFVRKMYDREFCALDLCGQAPRYTDSSELECVESQLSDDNGRVSGTTQFKTWQLKDSHHQAFTRPVLFQNPTLFSSPWVKHFMSTANGRAIHMQLGFPDFNAATENKGLRHNEPLQETVDESFVKLVPVVEQNIFTSQDRLPNYLQRCCSSFAESKQSMPTIVMHPSHCSKGVLRLLEHKQQLTKMDCQLDSQVIDKYFTTQNCQFCDKQECAQPANRDSAWSKQACHSFRTKREQVRAEERPLKIQKVSREGKFSAECNQVTPDCCHREADKTDGRSVISDHSIPVLCSTDSTGSCVCKVLDPGKISVRETVRSGDTRECEVSSGFNDQIIQS